MPSLKAIRRRIASVKNTQKITKAMKQVAAAKLRRAQESIIAARPYAQSMGKVVGELAARAGDEAHPLLDARPASRAEIVLLTSDRGLAGSFNAQVVRRVESFTGDTLADYAEVSLRTVGRKGNEYFKRRGATIRSYVPAPTSADALAKASELTEQITEDFLSGQVDRVYLVYNEFKSAISQKVTVEQILPVVPEEVDPAEMGEYTYEPSKRDLLDHLLPLAVQTMIFRASLESIAAEFGARMSAMDAATRNAREMIDRLTLQYNRARQAAITKELLEIIAGAEALKG